MYADAATTVHIKNNFSEKLGVKVGFHQRSFLSPLLFLIVMEALSQDCWRGYPWELLYANDLVIMKEFLDELLTQFTTWKDIFDTKGLQVYMSKTKILVSNPLAEHLIDPSKYPRGMCKKVMRNNSIFCHHCKSWIHHRCSNIKGRPRLDPNFKCQ